MKKVVILAAGIVLFTIGFLLQMESEKLALVPLPPGASSESTPAFTVDESKEKAYNATGEDLAVLAVVLLGIAAFSWIRPIEKSE